jgi:hypothetical protein
MTSDGVPPWGSPDGGTPGGGPPDHGTPDAGPSDRGTPDAGPPDHGTPGADIPDYGTPPPASGRPDRYPPGRAVPPPSHPSPDPASTSWGSPVPGQDLLDADTVVVVERAGFLTTGGYELTTVNDIPLGSLIAETSAAGLIFGSAATTTYRLLDTRGALIGSMLRPGTLGRSRFVVTDAGGAEIGTVEQENSFGSPQLLVTTAEGLTLRLTGGQWGSREWRLVDGIDPSVLMGLVSQQYSGLGGMMNDTHRFAVQLTPQLVGDHRLLAVMATVCLDYIRDKRR